MEIKSPRWILRDFLPYDIDYIWEIESMPETHNFESSRPTFEQTERKLRLTQEEACQSPRTRYRLAVAIPPLDQVRGRISLTLNNESIREWEIGWAIHPEEWGKGIAMEAAHRILAFAFDDLLAHRVVAFSHVENTASLQVMKKLNMHQEGLLRETRHWKNEWSDEVVYSILEREWVGLLKNPDGNFRNEE